MSEELGKIEKPPAEKFRHGRKLYLVPLIYSEKEAPAEYQERCSNYWKQVEEQVSSLELKLGKVHRVYHELVSLGGAEGATAIEELNERSYETAKYRLEKGAEVEALEEAELLTELLDWSRCLAVGLQNRKVGTQVYEAYIEVSKKRNEHLARQIDDTLKADESGLLFMREGHQVQFPPDIQVFYVAPPALDELKRWLRGRPAEAEAE